MIDQEQMPDSASRSTGPVVVVGLGNPGIEYVWTPHNAGFLAIDRIAEQEGAVVQNRRCKAQTGTARIAGREVILAKPETFMNLSGLSVAALVKEFGIPPEERADRLVILYDELDLPLGSFKIKERGSPAGHNGARSITGSLGSQEWLRVKIGVGPNLPQEAIDAGARRRGGKDYLLDPMSKKDLAVLDEVLDRVAAAVRRIVTDGPAAAMNEFNRKDLGA
ncbi:MAG TPA: aminoacyl-tRNA hydrolase [Acidobacteriaceae bacterium]|nr:aminoacyl-tRNA hydrolase [Acidobacteriaceae bacterium]